MSRSRRPPEDNVISLFGRRRSPPEPPEPPAVDKPAPTLRAAPEAPPFTDPRQAKATRILTNLNAQLPLGAGTSMVNMTTGMAAADLRVGKLQDLLEAMLVEYDMDTLRTEWTEGVGRAVQGAIEVWVQRLKELELDVRDNGVHVRMQTQDDRGYYRYSFDIFPGREPAS